MMEIGGKDIRQEDYLNSIKNLMFFHVIRIERQLNTELLHKMLNQYWYI